MALKYVLLYVLKILYVVRKYVWRMEDYVGCLELRVWARASRTTQWKGTWDLGRADRGSSSQWGLDVGAGET